MLMCLAGGTGFRPGGSASRAGEVGEAEARARSLGVGVGVVGMGATTTQAPPRK